MSASTCVSRVVSPGVTAADDTEMSSLIDDTSQSLFGLHLISHVYGGGKGQGQGRGLQGAG